MLSATYTISDVKSRLGKEYSFYGYSDDYDFEVALTNINQDVMYIYLYPKIGSDEYTIMAAKDRTSLTETETYLYWAEIYATCYEFLKSKESSDGQLQYSNQESLKVEGYSYTSGTSYGTSPNDKSLNDFYSKMHRYFGLAGYNVMALQRTCTIFGDSTGNQELKTYINI